MAYDRGLFCPQVFCDGCGERIKDAAAGNVYYLPGDDPCVQGKSWAILFMHKRCSLGFEQSHADIWMCGELQDFVLQLPNNLDFTEEARRERAKLLVNFGF